VKSRDEVTALGSFEAEQTTSQDKTLDQYPIYLEFFFFFGTDFDNSTATKAANQRTRKSMRAAHVQYDQIFRRFSIHSVFSATPLLSITALFREPKACEDHPNLILSSLVNMDD
jgi:hypothetical protein